MGSWRETGGVSNVGYRQLEMTSLCKSLCIYFVLWNTCTHKGERGQMRQLYTKCLALDTLNIMWHYLHYKPLFSVSNNCELENHFSSFIWLLSVQLKLRRLWPILTKKKIALCGGHLKSEFPPKIITNSVKFYLKTVSTQSSPGYQWFGWGLIGFMHLSDWHQPTVPWQRENHSQQAKGKSAPRAQLGFPACCEEQLSDSGSYRWIYP